MRLAHESTDAQAKGSHVRDEQAAKAGVGRGIGTAQSAIVALQRAVGNAAVATWLEDGLPAQVGQPDEGEPLPAGVRAEMERSFGDDFGDVRTHTGPGAAESARVLDAGDGRGYEVGAPFGELQQNICRQGVGEAGGVQLLRELRVYLVDTLP